MVFPEVDPLLLEVVEGAVVVSVSSAIGGSLELPVLVPIPGGSLLDLVHDCGEDLQSQRSAKKELTED